MKNKSLILAIIAVVVVGGVVAAIALGGNSKSDNSSMSDMNMSSSSSSSTKAVATDTVKIQNFAFSPVAITVKVGTKVTWTNEDSAPHTVTDDTGSSTGPSSQQLTNGQSYSFTFTKAGTYNYHCEVHPDMKAKVVVTE